MESILGNVLGIVLLILSCGWGFMLWKGKVEATKGGLICSAFVVVFGSISLILSMLIGQFVLSKQCDDIIAVLFWSILGALEANQLKNQKERV